MAMDDGRSLIDRRVLLGAGAAAVAGVPSPTFSQQPGTVGIAASSQGARAAADSIADFITGFDLNSAPPVAIERARTAFIDTVGVACWQEANCPRPISPATLSNSRAKHAGSDDRRAGPARRASACGALPTALPAIAWISTLLISPASRLQQ